MISLKNIFFRVANKLLLKVDRIIVSGNDFAESNAIEFANFIAQNNTRKIYYLASKEFKPYIKQLLSSQVKIINDNTIRAYYMRLSSKYIISTHGSSLAGSSKRQTDVNIWHGLLYKNIRLLRDETGLYSDITVGTSPLSQKMFSEAFGVPLDSIKITGYPRNDMMLRANENGSFYKNKLGDEVNKYDIIIFWMPTYRRKPTSENVAYNLELSNPFEVENFNIKKFNSILKENNALCLLKPHYYYLSSDFSFEYSNIQLIDDKWILSKELSLYQLLPLADILISDFSSVIYDYTLLDKPIICFCTDLEEYKRTQGLYFEDIENWLPSKLFQNEKEFFVHLSNLLDGEKDPYEDKRMKIKELAFTYHDANSSKRLMKHVFDK